MKYEINHSERTCFPAGLDQSSFIDVTAITDYWRKFIDSHGEMHDCEKYFNDSVNQAIRLACNNPDPT